MSLVVAIFLVGVIASLAAFAVTAGNATRETANLNMQGDRALAAARAGVEWGAYRALRQSSCPGAASPTTINLTQGALRGFRVTVTCLASTSHTDALGTYRAVDITAFAQWSNFGAADYASRTVSVRYQP